MRERRDLSKKMDHKQIKQKNKILKFLPRAASAVNFYQNPPFSPNRDHKRHDKTNKSKTTTTRGYSGPIVSMIPSEARRKHKNGSFEEPTSPKVSCMGQIKHKKKIIKCKAKTTKKDDQEVKGTSKFKRLFSGIKQRKGNELCVNSDDKKHQEDRARSDFGAPPLSQMKRFASGRNSLSDFDWTTQIAPEEIDGHHHGRDYYSDEDRGYSDDEDDVIIPFSAPITVGSRGGGGGGGDDGGVALKPRKEINLWKRRTMNPPRPLQLNSTVRAT